MRTIESEIRTDPDGVTTPALPAGWVATNAHGQNPLWVTAASAKPYTAPNSAFVLAGAGTQRAPSVSSYGP